MRRFIKATIRYRNARGRTYRLGRPRRCRYDQYLMMHALTMRTEVVRASVWRDARARLPMNYLYSFVPLPYVSTIATWTWTCITKLHRP